MLGSVGCFETAIIVALVIGFFGGAIVALFVRMKRGPQVQRRGGKAARRGGPPGGEAP